ncbi:MAG: terminase [Chloroflexi bacterium]|nr:terminase [Chloroflexota bacterium]
MVKADKRGGRNRTRSGGTRTGKPRGRPAHAGTWVKAFLHLREHGASVTQAAERVHISRSGVYAREKKNAKFANAMLEARLALRDRLEDEVWRRGVDGVEEPVLYQGEVVTTIRRFSDRLLEVRLRAEYPEKYRETGPIMVGAEGGKVLVCNLPAPNPA